MNIFNDDMDYGYKNSYSGGGTVHEHVWNWKVDLDIAGMQGTGPFFAAAAVQTSKHGL